MQSKGFSRVFSNTTVEKHVHKYSLFGSPTNLFGRPTNTIGHIVLYCNKFIILFTQILHEKETNTKIKKMFLILQCSALNRTAVPAPSLLS